MRVICARKHLYRRQMSRDVVYPGGKVSFTAEDERLFTDYLAFAGIGLMNAQLFEMSILENKRSKILLNMAR